MYAKQLHDPVLLGVAIAARSTPRTLQQGSGGHIELHVKADGLD